MKWRFTERYGKLIPFVLFWVVYMGRLFTMGTELPESWRPESQVKITLRILEKPEQTDSKTIIYKGKWRIERKGYTEYEVGERYSFQGEVEVERWGGGEVEITMVEPEVRMVEGGKLKIGEWMTIQVAEMRERMVEYLAKALPEPEASLAAGILLGVKRKMPWEFYQALIETGTVHIVAASGYNVTIVARVVMVPLLKLLGRAWAIPAGIGAIIVYVIIAGGSAAVIRAAVMASLTLLAYYFGRPSEAKRLLWLTAIAMLMIQPLMMQDVGFQLSVAATAGLLYVEPWVRKGILRKNEQESWLQRYLAEYLMPTLAANITTLPIILMTFGRISFISPIVNMLVLPLTPLIMFLAAVVVAGGIVSFPVGRILALILYVPLWVMVEIVKGFGGG